MRFRRFWGLASLASTLVTAVGLAVWGCSAPDPGEIDNAPAYNNNGGGGRQDAGSNNNGGGNNGGGNTGGNTGGGDAGGGGTAANVFTNAPAYVSGQTGSSTLQSSHAFGDAGQNPAGQNCVSCHTNGGSGVAFAFGGTVYTSSAATTPAGAGVEVRVGATSGDSVISVYTDENGNFYKLASAFTIPSGAQAGVRNANGKKAMPANKTPGAGCEKSGCHTGASGENPRIWISP